MKEPRTSLCAMAVACLCVSCADLDPDPAAEGLAETTSSPPESAVDACIVEADAEALCGPQNAEDLLRLGESRWLLASGMNGALFGSDVPGTLHLIDHETRTYEELFPSDAPVFRELDARFANCPGPVDAGNMSFHGLALRETAQNEYELYVTSHGAREAIEVFAVDASAAPTVEWIGCVPMPSDSFTNSVVILNDGGFFATKFMDPVAGIESVYTGGITGHVFEWHPGSEVEIVPGTELSGANGIEISEDERWLYVAAFGQSALVRFDLSTRPVAKETLALGVVPDNVRWSPQGTLLTAGARGEGAGWAVVEVDPQAWTAREIAGVDAEVEGLADASVALAVGEEIWVGSYNGDRLIILQN